MSKLTSRAIVAAWFAVAGTLSGMVNVKMDPFFVKTDIRDAMMSRVRFKEHLKRTLDRRLWGDDLERPERLLENDPHDVDKGRVLGSFHCHYKSETTGRGVRGRANL